LYAVLAAWLLLTIVRMLGLAVAGDTDPENSRFNKPLIAAVQRSFVVIATVIVVIIMARIWAVEVFGVVMDAQLETLTTALSNSFIVLIGGYVAYEAIKAWAAARFGTDVALAGPESEDVEDLRPRSRLSTIIPFLTGSLLVVIIMIAALLGLSDLGFNTAPILAGAGIFGLAISFGSQALVRDIVSGIFYMIDDAFRVGEYIETGRLKGTVEKIMLRSLRVRHQNGQFHTIPYGQLGAVTNYSRDWSTIKFNLSLARDSDLEKVRKAAKQCGQALLADPDFGIEFILPLKLQGVADIRENAIICRFKFTVRPLRPTQVQREALKRLYQALIEKGIEFATHTVKVVTSDGGAATDMVVQGASTMSITHLRPSGREEGVAVPVFGLTGTEVGQR
ncbi:MAG: mechanosensitive ion channel family protein, partial [Beijerinckiaceae bacterium]|nr:mechanosensitive ion channel family protein [Beijerinckiaceae bacterium]